MMISRKDFLKSYVSSCRRKAYYRPIQTGKMLHLLAGRSRSLGQQLGKHGYRRLIDTFRPTSAAIERYQSSLCWSDTDTCRQTNAQTQRRRNRQTGDDIPAICFVCHIIIRHLPITIAFAISQSPNGSAPTRDLYG